MNYLFLAMAVAAGAAISAQAAVNSQLASGLGGLPITAAFMSFLVGSLVLGVMAAATGDNLLALPARIAEQPLWRLAGGILGAGAICCTVLLAPRMGLAVLLALVIAGQLLSSIVIDNFGLLGMEARPATAARVLGAVIMMAGVTIALFGDRFLDFLRRGF